MQASSSPLSDLAWDDVRLFLTLCRSRTMGEAAAALEVDASTVSRRLVALEEQLETVLFDRGRDGLRPTKAAEDLRPAAEIAEDGIAQFATAADGLEREVSGLVKVTCPPDVAEVVVLPALRRLLPKHPGLRVTLEPGQAIFDLSRREADLALRVVRPTRGDLIAKRVLKVTWKPAAKRKLAKRLSPLRDLSQAPWIGWSERSIDTPAARWLEANVGSEPVLRSDQLAVHVAAAKAGIGIALLPAPSIEHYGLVAVEVAGDSDERTSSLPTNDLFLVTHRALVDVPRVRAVWNGLVEHLAVLSGEEGSPTSRVAAGRGGPQ